MEKCTLSKFENIEIKNDTRIAIQELQKMTLYFVNLIKDYILKFSKIIKIFIATC